MIFADDIGSQLLHGIFSAQFVQFLVAAIFAFLFPITSAAVINYLERKILAWMADRVGPLHTGPHGSLQLLADIGKMFLKEDVKPRNTDRLIFLLAPSAFLAPMIAAFAVLPFSPYIGLPSTGLATGIVYVVAMSSLDIVGVIMAGWGSNNKYSLIGSLRGAAQMISYELPLVLALVGVVMLSSVLSTNGMGAISIKEIIGHQSAGNWPGQGNPFWDFVFEGNTPWAWFILVQPLMLIIYYICGLAETNRVPFDLPTAESELVAGFLTEYSGLRWAFFFLGEYGNMTIVAAITVSLFLGGWSGPGGLPDRARYGERLGDPGQRPGRRLLHPQGLPADLPLPLAAGHAATPALGPVDAVRLADPDSADPRQHSADRAGLPTGEQSGTAEPGLPARAGPDQLGYGLRLHPPGAPRDTGLDQACDVARAQRATANGGGAKGVRALVKVVGVQKACSRTPQKACFF